MNAIGAYVSSTTTGKDYELIEDRIMVKAQGFAVVDEVLNERTVDGVYRVKVKASVSKKPLAEMLKGLGITRNWKVAVVLSEESNGEKSKPSAAPEIEKALLKSGFKTIDRNWNDKLVKDEALTRAQQGDRAALADIKQEYGVDVLVTGDASAEAIDEQPQGGLRFIRSTGTVEARALYTDTGEILTVLDSAETKLGETESLSAREALKSAGRSISSRLVDDLLAAPAELRPFVTLKISGFSKAADAARFERAIGELPGVQSVKRQRFTKGMNEMNVVIDSEDLDSLAEALEDNQYTRPFRVVVESWSKALVTGRIAADINQRKKGASYVVVPPKRQ
jgi:hypothetical protein